MSTTHDRQIGRDADLQKMALQELQQALEFAEGTRDEQFTDFIKPGDSVWPARVGAMQSCINTAIARLNGKAGWL